ncbi:MAG: MmgE/PrpD family protein, partial [Thermoleophilaceae bacterium]
PLLLDGRAAGLAGAAFAGAATIDSFDAHDGHALAKGHAGVVVLPATLALRHGGERRSGRELLTSLVVGYEVSVRAGMALHATAGDYHASGAWNAIACAALGARALGLGGTPTRHALGIAEYHAPRSQMMRCIDHPTMVRDGSAWGALAGVGAAQLAAEGFTGAPALLTEDAERWSDLGTRWRIVEQYIKPYPVCRWAQPAMESALALQRDLELPAAALESVTVTTFHEASRLACATPSTTEEAQYSLPFAVAAALVRGRVGAEEIGPRGIADREILRLSRATTIETAAAYDARFPAERWAHVTFRLRDGRGLGSEPATARGGPEDPLDAAEVAAKYRALARPVLGAGTSALIEAAVGTLGDTDGDEPVLFDLLATRPAKPAVSPGSNLATTR